MSPYIFDGIDLYQLYCFLFQCCFYFHFRPTIFKSDCDKINFAMTYVSGVIQDWLQVALEQENQDIHHVWLYFWSSFVKEICMYFGIPAVIAEAAHSLDHLHMNPDDQIAIYNIAFLQYSAKLQWTENALCHRYYVRLPDCIQDIISTHEGNRSSIFQTLYSMTISIKNYFWEQKCESERALYSTLQCLLYLEYSESVSKLSLSNSSFDVEALESSDKFPTWQHTLSSDLSDTVSKLLLSVSNSGSIVSKSLTSVPFLGPQQILSAELSNSTSVLLFLTSSSSPRIPRSLVKPKSLY